jgi:hypothetical protein
MSIPQQLEVNILKFSAFSHWKELPKILYYIEDNMESKSLCDF